MSTLKPNLQTKWLLGKNEDAGEPSATALEVPGVKWKSSGLMLDQHQTRNSIAALLDKMYRLMHTDKGVGGPSSILRKIRGKKPPPGQCNQENDSDCCKQGKLYTTYKCSPPVSGSTKAVLTINSFQKGGDGGGPSECDNQYHSDDTPVVALSTGWYSGGSRCLKNVTISGSGRSVTAMVVDECDSTMGCDEDHDYQPPCPNNIVDASKAVWKALGVPQGEWGGLDITWFDA
ncbi:hypothetical protein SASPL_111380 [Salvia splendens]|uniref:Ripening-related protein 2 n=1 Tax=Salvia splendens TaxID=180675 RepID=A0A8X8Y6B8_SALSN|nr:hypothetical protein SASPL_111380 [Salvia splendens]